MLGSVSRQGGTLLFLPAIQHAPGLFKTLSLHQQRFKSVATGEDHLASGQVPAAGSPPRTPSLSPAAFSDYKAIYNHQPTSHLFRALVVFRACGVPWFVKNADKLLQLSKTVLGERLTYAVVKNTFYAHFCAGEDDQQVLAKTKELQSLGIGSILDYAAEDDVKPDKDKQADKSSKDSAQSKQSAAGSGISGDKAAGYGTSTATPGPTVEAHVSPASHQPVLTASPAVARQYSYQDEAMCDAHVATFLSSISDASRMPGQGFAAVKLTALGNPRLLERVSSAIREVRAMFAQWDTDGSGFIDRQEFDQAYSTLLPDASEEERNRVFSWYTQNEGKIDYAAWCQRLSLSNMPEYAARIHPELTSQGSGGGAEVWRSSLQAAALTPREVQLVQAMRGRLVRLADAAVEGDVKLMVDAEHTYMQPAIDHLTMELMRKYNKKGKPTTIYNTYQAYLKDSHARLVLDLERARREGYILGAKLVRGAYLGLERARADTLGYPSPVWDTLDQTHENYSRCMEELLVKVSEGRAEVLLGTHNQASVEQAVSRMSQLGLSPSSSPVYFGQLLGMSDHLTQVLGAAGYKAYKYVPYGKVDQVIPYLLRRAAENASIMKGAKRDVQLLQAELLRRARHAVGVQSA